MKYPHQESSTLELKAKIPKRDQIIRTLIGFCNQNGGKIILGVANDRTILGLDETEIEETKETLDRAVFQACSPPIIPRIYTQNIGEKTLLILEVSEGMSPPYCRTSEGMERGVYIRLGRSTVRADAQILHDLHLRAQGRSYDSTPVYQATEDDLNKKHFLAFLEKRKGSSAVELSDQTLQAYRVLVEQHARKYPSVGGMLLFGHQPDDYFSEAMIICTHFRGTSGRDVVATRDATGNLFDQVEKAYDFVLSCLTRSFKIEGLQRSEQWELPTTAIREVIINAVVHRNYQIPAPAKIAVYENRIEVFSPGQFPGPLDEKKLMLGLSFIRNQVITKIFREAHYIEKLGSGFTILFRSFLERNLATPQVIEGPGFVKVILPRFAAVKEEEDGILSLLLAAEEISTGDVMESLHMSRATAARKLKKLEENGMITRIGKGRSTRYIKSS